MNTLVYTRVFLHGLPWESRASDAEISPWKKCTVRPLQSQSRGKHPSVGKGKGYWETNARTTIVIGYALKSDPRVFRPVFQFMRNKRLQDVNNMIKDRIGNNQGTFMTRLRRNLYKRALLGVLLPVEMILYIGTYL